MPIDILMPALSPTMKRGRLARWVKSEGSNINPGDVIAEIETDKAIMELEAVDAGVLFKILVPEGTENVPVNAKIALLLEEGENLAEFQNEISAANVKTDSESLRDLREDEEKIRSSASSNFISSSKDHAIYAQQIDNVVKDRVFASPLARRLAKESDIDLSHCRGSGPRGRVIKSDILSFVQMSYDNTSVDLQKPSAACKKVISHSSMRTAIARKMSLSKAQIPHFYLSIDCCMDALLLLRSNTNKDLNATISIGDFVLKASAYALKRVPLLNSSWSEEGVVLQESIDICVAVGLEDGLITPIVFETDKKNLLQISSEVRNLAQKARDKKLTPQDYQGGSFTVSNLGMYGISEFSAIINYPQSAILAVGRVRKEVCVSQSGEGFEAKNVMKVTLSCDHRVIDGKVGAQWLKEFKDLIEKPLQLML